MSGTWTDPLFADAMREQEPGNRARFLSMMYTRDKESFEKKTPDEMLVSEFGIDKYLELLSDLGEILPIVAIPTIRLTT